MIRFLIDNNISPKISHALAQGGYESEHVRELQMAAASDDEIFEYASKNNATIISADTDFGYILSKWRGSQPSVILLRMIPPVPETQFKYIQKVIIDYSSEITEGSLLVVSPDRIRIRKLPLLPL